MRGFLAIAIVMAALPVTSQAGESDNWGAAGVACRQDMREVFHDGSPTTVYLSTNRWTEVVLPEPAAGYLPNEPQGLDYRENPTFPDRLFFRVKENIYSGTFFVNAQSGETILLQLLARDHCPDSSVQIKYTAPPSSEMQRNGGPVKGLLEYMLLDEQPPGYVKQKVPEDERRAAVYKQGSVVMFLAETYRGTNYTGYVLHAINQGRTPFHINLPAMDFSNPRLVEEFGRVVQITMQPNDFRLGPAPRYAVDELHPKNQGLVYIVAERKRGR